MGGRLAERRNELGKSLRVVALEAALSTSHLSDIENGVCQVSLPVLLRLVRALDLTITELLPRIGGHRVKSTSIADVAAGEIGVISHEELSLQIEILKLTQNSSHTLQNGSRSDVLIHVLRGAVVVLVEGTEIDLQSGDTLDTERSSEHVLTATTDSQVLTASGVTGK